MTDFDSFILNPIEDALDRVGLMQGSMAPTKRALVGAAVGAAVVYGVKPTSMWNGDKMKPWTPFAKKGEDSTWLPGWLAISIPAVVLGVLI